MTTFYRTTLPNGEQRLQEIEVGGILTVNGERFRVTAVTVAPAPEDDPELGVQAGDLVTSVELAPLPVEASTA